MCVATLPGLRIERHFAQAIIHEDQTAVGHSEFGKTDRLRSEVKSDQAGRSGHGVKGLDRNSKMPKQNFNDECREPVATRWVAKVERVVLSALARSCGFEPDICAFSESPVIVLQTTRSTFAR
jgi:hypothetical protein